MIVVGVGGAGRGDGEGHGQPVIAGGVDRAALTSGRDARCGSRRELFDVGAQRAKARRERR